MRGEEGIAVAMKDKTRGKMKWQDEMTIWSKNGAR
jgi:hypothetical protein